MISTRRILCPSLATTFLWAAACSTHTPAPAPLPSARKIVLALPDAGTPSAATHYAYAYVPLGKRDPFRSPIDDLKAQSAAEFGSTCEGPLCQWELDQLSLVGAVTGEANPLAMVEDPTGKGYVVRRATPIGKLGGKVTQILRDCITVTEYWTGQDGKKSPNPVQLCLKTDLQNTPDVDLHSGKKYP